ncbi:MAG TPA: valine--tRNA ligase [Acidimicrobiales bacterium]|nr:valine--tRNA ligase [Acidimicrobiales bacterium]
MPQNVPEKPALEGLEDKWVARWAADGTYAFDRSKTRDQIYSVDTPPPTVSGNLHIGHVCSYTHTDTIVRYQRMRGRETYYPMGWDDNGLNVERRVQVHYGVICDPSLPYDADFTPPAKPEKRPVPISRPNFVELCNILTAELEQAYFELWNQVGLSVDWKYLYRTIEPRVRRVSQRGFLRLLARGLAFRAEAPTLWDVDMKTSLSQADLEDREMPGAYHRIKFDDIEIETTRPELIPACVALVAHPDDERFKPRFGTTVSTPLFGAQVPVLAHELADPEKGSGIAMICTFGDLTDVLWWRELGLPVRAVVGRDGRLLPVTWGEPGWESADVARAQTDYDELAGKTAKQAQTRIVEMLRESGDLVGEPRPITHAVKFWENGSRPLEIVTNRQWFVKYPPKDELQRRGKELRWHPQYMQVRYENWVDGLAGDWNITRQRYFGVPFPVWYPVGADGALDHDHPLLPTEDELPIDPSTDVPAGYSANQRDQPGGFSADPDVMDTWGTSSLSPQIASGWVDDADLFERVFPMDLRPQAHDIIRTWLFYTVVRSQYEHNQLPWSNVAISGFVNDPDRKKLSKSAGNSPDDPMQLITQFGADAIRYWAAGARPGGDLDLDRNQFKIGRRLATKILNASRFALGLPEGDGNITEALDRAMLARLASLVDEVTAVFDDYDYARALERTETFFWSFCDDYLELVKARAYGDGDAATSATTALRLALSTLLRLFAPFLAFVTEEVWSWWQEGSIHRAPWPDAGELRAAIGDAGGQPALLEAAASVLTQVRRAKTERQKSMRAAVTRAVVSAPADSLALLREVEGDLREAGSIAALEWREGDEISVDVELAEAD